MGHPYHIDIKWKCHSNHFCPGKGFNPAAWTIMYFVPAAQVGNSKVRNCSSIIAQ